MLELRSVSYSKSTEASILSVVEWVLRASAIAEGAQDFESALWLARHACEYSSSENVRSLISSLEERIRISKLEIAFRQAKDLEELVSVVHTFIVIARHELLRVTMRLH